MQLKPQLRGLSVSELAPYLNPKLGDTITMSNGKKIGYLEFGDPSGKPIFYFHGALSSRIEAGIFAKNAKKNGIRLIALDRPGIGLSDSTNKFSFIDWPMVVTEVADALGIERFSVCGTSGGGAFSCACAAVEEVSRRLDVIILIAGMLPPTPYEKKLLFMGGIIYPMAMYTPIIICGLLKIISKQVTDGDMKRFKNLSFEVRRIYKCIMRHAVLSGKLQGQKGNIRDLALYAKPLGFQLKSIKIPLLAFTGLKDRNVPSAIATRVVNEVHNGKLITYEEADHSSILTYSEDICKNIKSFISDQIAV